MAPIKKQFYFLILGVLFYTFPSWGQALKKDTIYRSGDSTLEVKLYKELNVIREFIRVEGKEAFFYKEFDFKTKQLKTDGMFKGGYCAGDWKFYKKNGRIAREIHFEITAEKSYTFANEPYTTIFKSIKGSTDSLLNRKAIQKRNYDFYFHASHCYYYRSSFPKSWKTITNARPNEFLLRYDLTFEEEQIRRTFSYVELEVDSTGHVKKENYSSMISGYKNQDFISAKTADSIALQQGLTSIDQPFSFTFNFIKNSSKAGKLIYRIEGKPYDRKESTEYGGYFVTTLYFRYVDLDPWTAEMIGSGNTTRVLRRIP